MQLRQHGKQQFSFAIKYVLLTTLTIVPREKQSHYAISRFLFFYPQIKEPLEIIIKTFLIPVKIFKTFEGPAGTLSIWTP